MHVRSIVHCCLLLVKEIKWDISSNQIQVEHWMDLTLEILSREKIKIVDNVLLLSYCTDYCYLVHNTF